MNNSATVDLISGKEIQDFIFENEATDENRLVLDNKTILGVPARLVAAQIVARRKAKSKLPSWHNCKGIVYPPAVNLEQCSSETTAKFKAQLIASLSNGAALRGVDLSMGFGVDAHFLGDCCHEFNVVEPAQELLDLVKHNQLLLSPAAPFPIKYHSGTAQEFISKSSGKFDFGFIDPSRRNNLQKVFKLADCEPNIVELMPALSKKTKYVLIKASPLLDLQQGAGELGHVERIFVVAVDNECKEVLFLCISDSTSETAITSVNLFSRFADNTGEEFSFTFSEEKTCISSFSDPLTYIYEPNSAILKAGAFKIIGKRFGLSKLQVSTHLYTSDRLDRTFPGRIFEIENLKPETGKLKDHFPDGKVNIFTRNYPLSPDQLKKKLKLQDGGEKYLIGFSGEKQKFLVVARRC